MADEGFKRKLTAILSADVEGYSRLMDDCPSRQSDQQPISKIKIIENNNHFVEF